MIRARSWRLSVVLIFATTLPIYAADAPTKTIVDLSAAGIESKFTPTSGQVTLSKDADGLVFAITPGKETYAGGGIKLEGADGDLSAFGHVEAKIMNPNDKPLSVAIRVDQDGDWHDNPWDSESVRLKPGATGTVTLVFGYSYGGKPGYPVNPAKVAKINFFVTAKSETPESFKVLSISAGGPAGEKPAVDPNSIRVTPENGVILGAGAAKIDPAKQILARGAKAEIDGDSLKIAFMSSKNDQSVAIKPPAGRWDLRDCLEVRVKVKNDGKSPITPKAKVESNGGPSEFISANAIAPGAEAEIVIPFIAPTIYNGEKTSGNQVTSNTIQSVVIAAPASAEAGAITVTSIKGDLPSAEALPDWLGKRPPVEGDWTPTLVDEFDGSTLNDKTWNVIGENYYDPTKTHWSKEELSLADGKLTVRYEKKTGHQNDDPAGRETPYAAGFFDSFGKWKQRYGYFECRMKLPSAPGLWPGFWMMPDRGGPGGSKGARSSTKNHGMEFDIVEYLSGWGPYRYNIAMHYDGYAKDHKTLGNEKNYVRPDKDGYITAGLLWTPGSLEYYCQGKKILEWKNERISNVPAYFLFTEPQGGWDNLPVDDKQLPADWVIDYVRCWQRKDLASDVDGYKVDPAATP